MFGDLKAPMELWGPPYVEGLIPPSKLQIENTQKKFGFLSQNGLI
jgi:hypothetical protein